MYMYPGSFPLESGVGPLSNKLWIKCKLNYINGRLWVGGWPASSLICLGSQVVCLQLTSPCIMLQCADEIWGPSDYQKHGLLWDFSVKLSISRPI